MKRRADHVTAAIPFYGCRDTLRRAVESVLGQSHRQLTLVVVNDGDRPPWDLLADLDDPRLVRFDLEQNRGRYFADAVVLAATDAPYYLVQDADDWSAPSRVATLLRRLRAEDAVAAFSASRYHETGRESWVRAERNLGRPLTEKLEHRVHHCGLFKSDALRAVGGHYGGFRIGYDTLLVNFLQMTGPLVYTDEPLYHVEVRSDSLTRSPATGFGSPARAEVREQLDRLYADAFRAFRDAPDPWALQAEIRRLRGRHVTAEDEAALARESRRLREVLARPAPIDDPRLPWGGWAINLPSARRMLAKLDDSRPRRILEAGSGTSTVLLAHYAARWGATVVSLEHDTAYHQKTRRLLERFALSGHVDLRLAPLRPFTCADGSTHPWYAAELAGPFDFVLVDGPPERHGREAAFFAVAPHLAERWDLWLHDGERPHERRCVALWKRHFRFAAGLSGGEGRRFFELRGTAPEAAGRSRAASAAAPRRPVRGLPAGDSPEPLVSCILPTRDRRAFVPQAIRYFLRQDYPRRELLVVDDGDEEVADLIPRDPRIRYLRLDEPKTIGAKRNLACAEARGEVVVHWDDDDWMAGRRIRYQVERLLASGADLAALPRLYFYEPAADRSWEYTSPRRDRPWLAGATFCYRRELWRVSPFPDTSVGEDVRFLWSGRVRKTLALDDPGFYVAVLHGTNSCSRKTSDPGWRRVSNELVRGLLSEDLAFYRDLAAAVKAPASRPRRAAAPPAPPSPAPPPRTKASRRKAPGLGERPRVSCVMPTRDRRRFVPRAIAYFLRQDYPEKELIVLDDGEDAVADLLPRDERVRYHRLPAPASVGHKRNLGVELSRGRIIVHWDDDDWSAADRIRYQVEALKSGKGRVCGMTGAPFYDVSGGRFWHCLPGLHARMFFADVHGRSIAYDRELWGNGVRYPDLSLAEDARFLEAALQREGIVRIAAGDKFIYVRHGANFWQFRCGQHLDPGAWRALPTPTYLPAEDLAFYQDLKRPREVSARGEPPDAQ